MTAQNNTEDTIEFTVKLTADQVERLWELTGQRDPSRSVAILCEQAIEELEQSKSPQVFRTVIEWDFRDFDTGNPFLDVMDGDDDEDNYDPTPPAH